MKYAWVLVVILFVVACTQPAQSPQEERVVDWGDWKNLDGAVVFVSDGRVGAITFIVHGGEVEFDIGKGV